MDQSSSALQQAQDHQDNATVSLLSGDLQLPPGFRFHPTDEELVVHYLTRKLTSHSFRPIPIVTEVDLYKFDPWELPQQAAFGEKEWYFFSPRDRKYPNGVRPNRAAASGYWKATGTDKIIHSSIDGRKIGVKKALVFYKGRAPKGVKSNWIMHEYRLVDASNKALGARKKGSLRLDDWVLCRIYKKKAKSYSKSSGKSAIDRKMGSIPSLEEDILASLPEIHNQDHDQQAKLVLPTNDPFMQALLSGNHQLNHQARNSFAMNPMVPMELQLLRTRQQQQLPPTTEMLFPGAGVIKDHHGMWQLGSMLSSKEDQSQIGLGLLENLQRQQQQQQPINIAAHQNFQPFDQQQQGEVVDDSFAGNRFPSTQLEFNSNSFNLHTSAF